MTNLYTEFQFKMSICNGDNERKLKINGIFLSQRGITLPKIIGLNSIYFKINCIIHTYMINEGKGFDNKIMNLILSHLLIIN